MKKSCLLVLDIILFPGAVNLIFSFSTFKNNKYEINYYTHFH